MSQIQKVPDHIGDHYLEVRQYNKDAVQYVELPSKSTSSQPFLIGRTSDNNIKILNNTVSKHHAKITTIRSKYYLSDLDSVNGTFINGNKLKPNSQIPINNGDSIQFGKYECLYIYRDNTRNARSKSKGKINLKDYMFQEKESPIRPQTDIQQPRIKQKKKKNKVKEGRIKIPDITNYLQIESELEEPKSEYKTQEIPEPKERKKSVKKEGKVKLPQLEDYLTFDEKKNIDLHEKQKNIFLIQQKSKKDLNEKQRRIQQEKLFIELQKAKHSQDLLQKQLLIEQKLRKQQQIIEEERKRLQEDFVRKQQEKRQNEMRKIRQLQEKQKEMIQRLERERQQQLEDVKKREQQFKISSQNQYRTQYEKRKQQLEIQAQALAKQYENIYRQTIKKVRNQIDFQENGIEKMEQQIEKLHKENQDILNEKQKVNHQLNKTKKELITLSGRNKACVLYASQIQSKIDAVKAEKVQNNGYYQSNNSTSKKLKQSIFNCRKLLSIKKKQYQTLWSQILALKGSFHQMDSYSDISEYLDTIFQNAQIIQSFKEEYLEGVEAEKAIEEIWSVDLQENNQLQDKNRNYEAQMKKNIQQIDENTRDQIKKGTQQRLHMLKMIHMCSEQKKSAAKFLIQEMLVLEQDIHKYTVENEQIHKRIVQLITKTEKIKRDNEYLSEILFGQDEYGHHFDNMKFVINSLIDKIEVEKHQTNIQSCLKLGKDGQKLQISLQEETDRKKQIKDGLRKINQLGLAPVQIKHNDKNPLIFFGDLLTNRQIEIDSKNVSIQTLQNEIRNEAEQIRLLEEKRKRVSQNLERFKVEQLSNARKYLKN